MRPLVRFIPKNAVVRWLLFTAIVLVAGVVGLSAVFSDLGPGETLTSRVLWTTVVYIGGGLLIGLLLGRRWYLAIAESWGPVLFGVLLLLFTLKGASHRPGWLAFVVCLIAPPAAALLGGFLGWRLLGGVDSVDQRAS